MNKILNWLKDWHESIGLFKSHEPDNIQTTRHVVNHTNNIKEQAELARLLLDRENERKTTIENKSSQLLSQSGLVISLVAIIIPLLISNISKLHIIITIIIAIIFIISITLFTNAIFHTASLTKVKEWEYMDTSIDSTRHNFVQNFEFEQELIKDYNQSYQRNLDLNNQKADYLTFAANSFSSAAILTGLLISIIFTSLLFEKEESTSIETEKNKPIEVKITNQKNSNTKSEKQDTFLLHQASKINVNITKIDSSLEKINKSIKKLNIHK